MNKVSVQALNDYLVSGSDMDLKMFVLSCNPMFVINAKSKNDINNLVFKYKADPTNLRLKALEGYLSISKAQSKVISKAIPVKLEEKPVSLDPEELTLKKARLEELSKTLMRNLKDHSSEGEAKQESIYNEIRQLRYELGMSV